MLDIVIAIDSLPGDFERSSRDIRGFCEEIQNDLALGVDDAIVTFGTSDHDGAPFSDVFYYDFFYSFDRAIIQQWRRSYRLVEAIETILNFLYPAPDGTIVPRTDAPDVVIVLSEGDSTVEAQNFIQRIEPRAR